MQLSMEVGLAPSDFVLDGNQLGGKAPQILDPFLLSQMAGWIKVLVDTEEGLGLCVRWGPSSPSEKRAQAPPPNFRPESIVTTWQHVMAGWINMPLGTQVNLGPGDTVFDRSQLSPHKQLATPTAPVKYTDQSR